MVGSLRALTLRCDIGLEAVACLRQVVSRICSTAVGIIVREIGYEYPQYQIGTPEISE
jgi:hypothetical protein